MTPRLSKVVSGTTLTHYQRKQGFSSVKSFLGAILGFRTYKKSSCRVIGSSATFD